MTVAAEIILISTAFQSNGILSYTLNIFKTNYFLKSTQPSVEFCSNRSKNLSVTWNRFVNAKSKMLCTCAKQSEMRTQRPK